MRETRGPNPRTPLVNRCTPPPPCSPPNHQACYKSGGLLTEALLMEELSEADCSVLTNFRDSFVEKVREVDAAARESNKDLGASAAAAAAAEGGPGRPSM